MHIWESLGLNELTHYMSYFCWPSDAIWWHGSIIKCLQYYQLPLGESCNLVAIIGTTILVPSSYCNSFEDMAPINFIHLTIYIDGLMQERHNSIANALELRLSCSNHQYMSGYQFSNPSNGRHVLLDLPIWYLGNRNLSIDRPQVSQPSTFQASPRPIHHLSTSSHSYRGHLNQPRSPWMHRDRHR